MVKPGRKSKKQAFRNRNYLGTVPVDPSPPPNCTVCRRFTAGRRYSVPFRDHPRFDAQPWLRQFAPKGRNIDSPGWSAAQPGGSGHDNTNTVPEKGPISLYDIVLASLLAPFRDHPCWRRVPRVPRPAAASPGASSIRSLSGTVPITPRLPRIARPAAASPGARAI